MALFSFGLQAMYLVLASTDFEIASEMKALQDMQHEFTVDLFSRGQQEYGVPDEALQNLGKHVQTTSKNGTLTTHTTKDVCIIGKD